MGIIGIFGRRLKGGEYVQYGWAGRGSTVDFLGPLFLEHYSQPDAVEYLFGLGQMEHIGLPISEVVPRSFMDTTVPSGRPHWVGRSEDELFSKIAFIDIGYFYDTDNKWYFIITGPFRVKVPLKYIVDNLDYSKPYPHQDEPVAKAIEIAVLKYILSDYAENDQIFRNMISAEYQKPATEILDEILKERYPTRSFLEKYRSLYTYFDRWIVVVPNEDNSGIKRIEVRPGSETHIETIKWTES